MEISVKRLLESWLRSPQEVEIFRDANQDAALCRRDKPLRILSWNIQFAAGRSLEFFYDGGEAVYADPEQILLTLHAMQELLADTSPDLVFWQEVDRNSRRTGYRDELCSLWPAHSYRCWASADYHKVPYVPHRGRARL